MKYFGVFVLTALCCVAYATAGKCFQCICSLNWILKTFFFCADGENICELPHTDSSMDYQCKAAWAIYHYNHLTGKCEPDVYGGCGKTANNFWTLDDCEKACGDYAAQKNAST